MNKRVRRYPIPTRRYPRKPPVWPRRSLFARASGVVSVTILVLVTLAVVAGPALVGWRPEAVATEAALRPPSPAHWLGTDMFGRDVLSRLLYGGRLSLTAAVGSVLIAAGIGTLLGVVAGYAGGLVDDVISAVANVLLAFPGLLLALVLAWLLGRGIGNAALGVAIAGIPVYVRLARVNVRQVRRAAFVRAARSIGARDRRILLRHVVPNIWTGIATMAVLDLGWAMLHISAISFLGVGARPPQPEWGAMLSEARAYTRQAYWLGLAPGLAIAVTVFGANLLADAIQSAVDPVRPNYFR